MTRPADPWEVAMRMWERFWYAVGLAIGNAVVTGRALAHHVRS